MLDQTGHAELPCRPEDLAGQIQFDVHRLALQVIPPLGPVIDGEEQRPDIPFRETGQEDLSLLDAGQRRVLLAHLRLTEFHFQAESFLPDQRRQPADDVDILFQRVEGGIDGERGESRRQLRLQQPFRLGELTGRGVVDGKVSAWMTKGRVKRNRSA